MIKLYGTTDHDNGNGWDTNRMGAVYIMFMETDGTVKSTVTIDKIQLMDQVHPPDARGYGRAIENLGDLDGDGVIDIAVGAYFRRG